MSYEALHQMRDPVTRTFDTPWEAIIGLPDSTLAETTIQAYLQAEYRIHAEPPFSLRVGRQSTVLQALFETTGTASAAFITPYNPLGHLLSKHENQLRLAELQGSLEAQGKVFMSAEGLDPHGEWPPEKGVLILGIAPEQAREVGRKFRQNAVLCCDEEGLVRLALLV